MLGAGRGVQAGEVETPAMAAEARRARRGAESDEEGDGGDGAQDSERVSLRRTVTPTHVIQAGKTGQHWLASNQVNFYTSSKF